MQRQRLQDSRSRSQEFAMKLEQGGGVLDRHLGSVLTTTTPGVDLFTPGSRIDVTTPFKLDQVPTVAAVVLVGALSIAIPTTAATESPMPHHSRCPIVSPKARTRIGKAMT